MTTNPKTIFDMDKDTEFTGTPVTKYRQEFFKTYKGSSIPTSNPVRRLSQLSFFRRAQKKPISSAILNLKRYLRGDIPREEMEGSMRKLREFRSKRQETFDRDRFSGRSASKQAGRAWDLRMCECIEEVYESVTKSRQ